MAVCKWRIRSIRAAIVSETDNREETELWLRNAIHTVPAPPLKGAAIVNIGDFLMRW